MQKCCNRNICNVLVIIPAHNEESTISFAVNSVLLQKVAGTNLRILIVDDNSSDKTYEVALELSKKFNNVYVIRLRRRADLLPSVAADLAVRYGVLYVENVLKYKWDYLLYLDADTVLSKNYLLRILKALCTRKDAGLAGGVLVNEPQAPMHIPGTGMVIKRAVWNQIGGFNGAPASDTIFQLEAIKKGWRLIVVKEAKIFLLRRTGEREKGRRCKDMGLVDGYICSSIIYSMLRAFRLLISTSSLRCFNNYLVFYLKGKRNAKKDICSVRSLIEKSRLRQYVKHILFG